MIGFVYNTKIKTFSYCCPSSWHLDNTSWDSHRVDAWEAFYQEGHLHKRRGFRLCFCPPFQNTSCCIPSLAVGFASHFDKLHLYIIIFLTFLPYVLTTTVLGFSIRQWLNHQKDDQNNTKKLQVASDLNIHKEKDLHLGLQEVSLRETKFRHRSTIRLPWISQLLRFDFAIASIWFLHILHLNSQKHTIMKYLWKYNFYLTIQSS